MFRGGDFVCIVKSSVIYITFKQTFICPDTFFIFKKIVGKINQKNKKKQLKKGQVMGMQKHHMLLLFPNWGGLRLSLHSRLLTGGRRLSLRSIMLTDGLSHCF